MKKLNDTAILIVGLLGLATGAAIALDPFATLAAKPALALSEPKTRPETQPVPLPALLARAVQTPPSPLPGGASSLSESYQDWQVTCSSQGNAKRCAMKPAAMRSPA